MRYILAFTVTLAVVWFALEAIASVKPIVDPIGRVLKGR